jgi:DNA-binding MarR family transcriptional regulator
MKSHGLVSPGFPAGETADNRRMPASAAAAPEEVPPFVDDYLPALLAQAHYLIAREFHAIVRERGFTVSEWRVLASLAGSGPVPIGQLAQLVVMKQPTVTRVLDRQEARGEVRRIAHKTDRRITLVTITPKGTRLVSQLIRLAREHEQRVLEPFGLGRAAELKATLKQMIALHQLPEGAPVDEEE